MAKARGPSQRRPSTQRSSPDGKRIVTASDDETARIWDAETGRALATLDDHDNLLWTAVFSSDSRRVVTSSIDRTARIFDAETGRILATLRGHEDQVRSSAFSPDGSRVVTSSMDKTVRIWDVAPDTRSPEEVEEFVRTRIPYRLSEQGVVVSHSLPEESK